MSDPRLVSKVDYARHRGVDPAMVTRWRKLQRIVLVGDKVDLEASDAALAASMDQARGGKRASGPKRAGDAGTSEQERGVSAPRASVGGPSYAQVQTARMGYVAQRERLRYEEELGRLVEADAVKKAIADALAPMLSQLDTLSVRIGPLLIGETELRRIQNVIDAEVRKIRQETADTLRAMVAGAVVSRQ